MTSQEKAIEFIKNNPGCLVTEICDAADGIYFESVTKYTKKHGITLYTKPAPPNGKGRRKVYSLVPF